jgi:hypothetical protein
MRAIKVIVILLWQRGLLSFEVGVAILSKTNSRDA